MRRAVGTYLYEERLLEYLPLSLNMLENWRQKTRREKKKGIHEGDSSAWKGTTVHKMNNLS